MSANIRKQHQPYLGGLAIVVACAALAIFCGSSSHAQFLVGEHTVQALIYCENQHFYNSRSTDAPAIVANSFEGRGSVLTFRTCADIEKNTHYFVRKPRPNRNGICRIFEEELFPGTAQDMRIVDVLYDGTAPGRYFTMSGWKSWPPAEWEKLHYSPRSQILAQASDGGCPPGDDKGYIPVGATTDGMLKQFFKLSHDISSSPEAFDKAFANTTSLGLAGILPKQDHDAFVRQVRSFLFGTKRVDPAPHYLDCDIIGRREGCSAGFQGFEVEFDVGDNGLVITQLNPVWAA